MCLLCVKSADLWIAVSDTARIFCSFSVSKNKLSFFESVCALQDMAIFFASSGSVAMQLPVKVFALVRSLGLTRPEKQLVSNSVGNNTKYN